MVSSGGMLLSFLSKVDSPLCLDFFFFYSITCQVFAVVVHLRRCIVNASIWGMTYGISLTCVADNHRVADVFAGVSPMVTIGPWGAGTVRVKLGVDVNTPLSNACFSASQTA